MGAELLLKEHSLQQSITKMTQRTKLLVSFHIDIRYKASPQALLQRDWKDLLLIPGPSSIHSTANLPPSIALD